MREPNRSLSSPATASRLLLVLAVALFTWTAPGTASAVGCPQSIVGTQAQVNALSGCTSFSGALQIGPSSDIVDLSPLANVTTIASTFFVFGNSALTNVDGLGALTSVGGALTFDSNSALTNVNGLANLGSVAGDVTFNSNAALTNVDALAGITSVGGALTLNNNDALTNVDGFANVGSVARGVTVNFHDVLTNVDGLAGITFVGGNLVLNANAALTNVDGLANIGPLMGGLTINNHGALTNVDGLAGITSVGGNLVFDGNSVLTNVDGLANLDFVSGTLAIARQGALTNVDGLAGVTSVGNTLNFSGNSVLTNLDGLANLGSVGGDVNVGLHNSLANLDGLAGINSVGGDLRVAANSALDEFCGLFPLLDAGGLVGTYTVTGNLANPTQVEILAGGPCPMPPMALVGPFEVFTSSQWTLATDGTKQNMADRSGLSGVGVLELQTHDDDSDARTMWHAGPFEGGLGAGATGNPPVVADQEIVFDLGIARELQGVYVWNHNQASNTGRGVDQFEILVSGDSDPLTAVYSPVGTFNLAQAGAGASEPPQLVSFSASGARLVKFDIQTAHSGAPNDYVGLSEVVFMTSCTIHRWSFDDPAGAAPDGTPARDVTCGDDGVVTDTGASYTGGGIQLPGGATGSGAAYVDLPNGLVSSLDSASFEGWYTIDGPQFWARLFDFGASAGNEVPPGPGGSGTNFIIHAVSQGNNTNAQRTEIAGVTLDTALPTSLGQRYHTVVTVEADGAGPGLQLVTVYRDGVQMAQGQTATTLAQVDDVNVWLGRSNFAGDGFLEGTIDEFRLYEESLSFLQVRQSFSEGSDIDTVALPEPGAPLALGSGLALLVALSRRRARKRL